MNADTLMSPRPIRTARLELIPGTIDLLRAELRGHGVLADALHVRIPPDWPPDLYDASAIEHSIAYLERHPDDGAWAFYYFVLAEDEAGGRRAAVGVGGFKGAPSSEGAVEIGYSVLSAYRRRGLATEAVRGLLGFAFADARVHRVIAETLPALAPSIGVLEKVGMRFIGDGSEPGVIRYEIIREHYVARVRPHAHAPPRDTSHPCDERTGMKTGARLDVNESTARVPAASVERSIELFRHGTLQVKMYAPRGRDPQTPHTRDEVYVVARGAGTFFDGERTVPFGPGDFLFAPAGVVHRFAEFTDDFFVWVLFYGPEGGEAPGP